MPAGSKLLAKMMYSSAASHLTSPSAQHGWRRAAVPFERWRPQNQLDHRRSAGKTLMIVESPTKAKKIQKFLDDSYEVIASYGHVKDLPARQGSVLPDQGFAMQWQTSSRSAPHVDALAAAARRASRVVLATDPDREGEAISWHILEELQARGVLRDSTAVERVTFTEVTRKAVTQALAQPRQLSDALVHAYLARRGLDYLMGFHLSPLLWRKLSGARSAGRVQSVALRLVCEREVQVEQFVAQEYWSIDVAVGLGGKATQLPARLTHLDGSKVQQMSISNEDQASEVAGRVRAASYSVSSISSKLTNRSPAPPFITSTLQQEANRRYGWSTSRTMSVAQQLYEGPAGTSEGLITYMRTDGYYIAEDALTAIRGHIGSRFGPAYLPAEPRRATSRAKNSQEAHEAIRPADVAITPQQLPAVLDSDQVKLYTLIWQRTVAYQMSSATFKQVAADFSSHDGTIQLRSSGSTPQFDGFLLVYNDSQQQEQQQQQQQDPSQQQQEEEVPAAVNARQAQLLAGLQQGQSVALQSALPQQHFTKAPGRYSEGSLVKALEELGIGRPSTYASTLRTLQERGYVAKQGSALVPSSLGRVVSAFLEAYFRTYVDYAFTSGLEQQLDEVSAGRAQWKEVLAGFWGPFQGVVQGMAGISVTQVFDTLDSLLDPFFFPTREGQPDPRVCPSCSARLVIKPARGQGAFIGCSNYSSEGDSSCGYSRPLLVVDGEQAADFNNGGSRLIGQDPASELPVYVKLGPYGPYVQLGEDVPKAGKAAGAAAAAHADPSAPRRAALPAKVATADVTLEQALALLSLPRELGLHPEQQQPVLANVGRFGPYVKCGTVSAALPKGLSVSEVVLDVAVELLRKRRERLVARGIDPDAPLPKRGSKAKAGVPAAGKKASAASTAGSKATAAKGSAKRKPAARKAKQVAGSSEASSDAGSGRPAKPPSAYLLFCKQRRGELKASGLQASPQEMMRLLAAEWKALPEQQRQDLRESLSQAPAQPTV